MNKSTDYIAGYNAGLLQQANVIEEHIVMIERSRAVLSEVIHPIELKYERGTFEADCFISSLHHLTLLLHVADEILYRSLPGLNAAANHAYGKAMEDDTKCARN